MIRVERVDPFAPATPKTLALLSAKTLIASLRKLADKWVAGTIDDASFRGRAIEMLNEQRKGRRTHMRTSKPTSAA